jgi:hypothetical protein
LAFGPRLAIGKSNVQFKRATWQLLQVDDWLEQSHYSNAI